MALIRTTRFTADPADADLVLERRGQLIAAIRAQYAGPGETRLIRVDERTWVDMWRWDSPEIMSAALAGAPNLPEAAAAFAVARDVTAEQGELVAEDGWTR
ncbi:hypothetical protein ACPPVO_24765 [Dactylosporangium sp. McL0621]|uniref:hypothetical protein n=1 Tax=Dactylosporangium sp. McL0621 TaxID=3415678 RepID=UPI003CEED0F7